MKKRQVIIYLNEEEILLTDQKKGTYSRSDFIRRALLIQLYSKEQIQQKEETFFFESVEPIQQLVKAKVDTTQLSSEEDIKRFHEELNAVADDDEFVYDPTKPTFAEQREIDEANRKKNRDEGAA